VLSPSLPYSFSLSYHRVVAKAVGGEAYPKSDTRRFGPRLAPRKTTLLSLCDSNQLLMKTMKGCLLVLEIVKECCR
jgi:hypothetical protein